MDISKRLQAVAGLVTRRSMADIGTDHGYVPLYLYEQGKIDRALACDLNKGPLEKAKENIAAMGAGNWKVPLLQAWAVCSFAVSSKKAKTWQKA